MEEHLLKKEMEDRYKIALPMQMSWWQAADVDTKMYCGNQDYWNQFYTVNFRNQRQLQFNKVQRVITLIGGHQRKNRKVSIATPVENSDAETADQLTGVMMWAMNRDGTYEKISDAFTGGMVCGMNMLHVWMDFREDPESGEIKSERVPYSAFIMDPYWKQTDMSDCDWIWQRRNMTAKQIVSIFPKVKKELSSLRTAQATQDGKFMYQPENRQGYDKDMFTYDEYWTREYKTVKKILNKSTGEVIDWPNKMTEERMEMMQHFNPNVTVIKAKAPTVKLHVLVNNSLQYEEVSPYGIDSYPYVPFLCYFNPEIQEYSYRYTGVVRNIRDSQVELNRRRNKMLDLLDSQVNSGLIVKENALVNPEDAFMSGQGRVLFLKDTAQITDVQHVQPPQIPSSMFELQKLLDSEIMNIAGVNEELFGDSGDEKSMSGFMTQLRMGAGLVSLQPVFDRLNSAQKQLGELFIKMIQANFAPGKVLRILNKQPTEQFKDESFQKYDCEIEEGMLTTTQRQMQFVQLLQLREMGIPVPVKILLETSTLQNKSELIKAIGEQEQQQMQMAQAKQMQDLEQQRILTRSLDAQAVNDYAAAEQKHAGTIKTIADAQHVASKTSADNTLVAVDVVKAAAEMENLDKQHLLNLTKFIMEYEMKQKELSQKEQERAANEAGQISGQVEAEKQKTEKSAASAA